MSYDHIEGYDDNARNGAQIGDTVRIIGAAEEGKVGKFVANDEDAQPFLVSFDGLDASNTSDYYWASEIEPVDNKPKMAKAEDVAVILNEILDDYGYFDSEERNAILERFADIGVELRSSKRTYIVTARIDAPDDIHVSDVLEKIGFSLRADEEWLAVYDITVREEKSE